MGLFERSQHPDENDLPIATRPIGANPLDRDVESCARHALLECGIVARRPHREHASRPKRSGRDLQALRGVEGTIRPIRQRVRTVVDVEQDRIKAALVFAEHERNIAQIDRDARVVERLTGKRGERAADPIDDGRNELRDDQASRGAKTFERGTDRVAHPESTDEHE